MRTAVIVAPIAVRPILGGVAARRHPETGCASAAAGATIPAPVPRRSHAGCGLRAIEPVWRADLFSVVGGVREVDPAHYHPTFSGLVPCERVTDR